MLELEGKYTSAKIITPTADIVDHLIPIYNFKANVNYKKNKK